MLAIEEEMKVPKEDVGRIIGKSGATIKEIKAASGCDVKVHSELATVYLKGTPSSIEMAKLAIRNIVGGEGMVILRGIEEQPMGYVSKRGFLKEIQQQYGVEVEIDRRSLRIMSLTGNTHMAEEARDRIKERIEQRDVLDSGRICVPRSRVQDVLTSQLLIQFQHKIQVEAHVDEYGAELELQGLRGLLEEAADAVHYTVNGVDNRESLPLWPHILLESQDSKLQDLNRDMHAYVDARMAITMELRPHEGRLVIGGSPEYTQEARAHLEKLLVYYFPQSCASISIPPQGIDVVAGDAELMRMREHDLLLSLDRTRHTLWVSGEPEKLKQCTLSIGRKIDRLMCSTSVSVEDADVLGWIIGTKGENVSRIEQQTGATLTVGKDLTVHITGAEESSVKAARRIVLEIVHSFDEQRGKLK